MKGVKAGPPAWLEIRTNDQALISDLAVEMAAMKIRPLSPRS